MTPKIQPAAAGTQCNPDLVRRIVTVIDRSGYSLIAFGVTARLS